VRCGEAILVTACNQQQVCACAPSKVFKHGQTTHKRWEQAKAGSVRPALRKVRIFDSVVNGDWRVGRFFAHRDFCVQKLERLVGRFDRNPHVGRPDPESAQSEARRADLLGVPDAVIDVEQNRKPVPGFFPDPPFEVVYLGHKSFGVFLEGPVRCIKVQAREDRAKAASLREAPNLLVNTVANREPTVLGKPCQCFSYVCKLHPSKPGFVEHWFSLYLVGPFLFLAQ
jgi:hypothetical protein